MTPHDAFLRLAATAVDEHLASPDRARLEQHVASCPSCARAAAGYRSDAIAIGALQPAMLSERRGAEILAAVLAPPSRSLSPVRLVLAVALLLLALAGSLWAGSELLSRWNEDLAVVVPVPSPTASPEVITSPSPVDDVLPAPMVVTVARENGAGSSTDWVAILEPDGRLTPLAEGSQGAWLDETTVVFACAPDICRVDVMNHAVVQMVTQDGLRPIPAPDGSMIAFHRGMIDVPETWLVRTEDQFGFSWRLADGDFGRWSPDGEWLVGQLPDATSHTVSTVNVDRSDTLGVDSVPGYDPAWSPSGARIVYTLVEGDGPSVRMLTPASGEVSVLYTAGLDVALGGPIWLNEAAIVFVQDGDLYRLDVGASTPVRLTSTGTVDVSGYTQGLELSPDGQWIAYTSTLEENSVVEVVSVDGSTTVTFPVDHVSAPRWGPVGAAVPSLDEASASAGPTGTSPPVDALGTTWSDAIVPVVEGRPIGRIESVTAGGPGFVAVGRGCMMEGGDVASCEGIVWLSSDGRTWERSPASAETDLGTYFPTSGPEVGMFDVASGGPGIVAIGYSYRDRVDATAWFSPDGATWQRVVLATADLARVSAVAWNGSSFVVVGQDRGDWNGTKAGFARAMMRAAAWTSPDGVVWTQVPHADALDAGDFIDTLEDPVGGGMNDVVSVPGGLIAVGSICQAEPAACRPAAWLSSDGISWDRVEDLPESYGYLSAVTASGDGSGYLAVGTVSGAPGPDAVRVTESGMVLTSPDGRTWTRQPAGPLTSVRSVTWIGDRFFATDRNGPVTVWTSVDGASWAVPDLTGGPMIPESGASAEWKFAATTAVAVWLGKPAEDLDPQAWVSPAR